MSNYEDLEYSELQAEAVDRGLNATGSTEDLIARLEDDDAAANQGPQDDGAADDAAEAAEAQAEEIAEAGYVGIDPQYANAASHHFAPGSSGDADGDDED